MWESHQPTHHSSQNHCDSTSWHNCPCGIGLPWKADSNPEHLTQARVALFRQSFGSTYQICEIWLFPFIAFWHLTCARGCVPIFTIIFRLKALEKYAVEISWGATGIYHFFNLHFSSRPRTATEWLLEQHQTWAHRCCKPCVHSERKFSVCSGQKYKIKSKSKEQNREHVGLHMHRSHMRYRKHQKACRKIPERLRAENQAWPISIFTRVICGAIQGMPVLQLYWPCSSQDMNLGLVELHSTTIN